MTDFIASMTYPFLACLLLSGIHVYLGIHVLERKVLFVDLALAQMAALGSVIGMVAGLSHHNTPWQLKLFSLGFAVLGASIFALTKMKHEKVPQEAIIGIAYAGAMALTMIFSMNLPHGADEVRELFSGSILWISGKDVAMTAVLYAIIGAVHYLFRKEFLAASGFGDLPPSHVKWWDFFFYLTFAFVVTSSVSIAGVLLVFSYLIIPASTAQLITDRFKVKLALGWGMGALISAVGVTVSYFFDLPSGPTIVVCFVGLMIMVALGRMAVYSSR